MAAAEEPLTSWGYHLDVLNGTKGFGFNLIVMVDDAPYTLNITDPNDRPELAKKVLGAIAKQWPNEQWQFYADANGTITDVVSDSAS